MRNIIFFRNATWLLNIELRNKSQIHIIFKNLIYVIIMLNCIDVTSFLDKEKQCYLGIITRGLFRSGWGDVASLTMGLLKAACLEWGTSPDPSPLPRAVALPDRWVEGLLPKVPLGTVLQPWALGFAMLLMDPLRVSAHSSSSKPASW